MPRLVAEAHSRLQPAQLRYCREPVQIGFNRRLLSGGRVVMAVNPAGAVVPWVDVLAVEKPDGKRLAVLFSHAAHPVIVHATSTLISADYPGFAVQELRKRAGEETVYLFAQGCGGNVNAFPLRGGLEAAAAAGRELAEAVIRALRSAPPLLAITRLKVVSEEIALPLQSPPSVEECEKLVADAQEPDAKARRQELLAISRSSKPQSLRFPLRALVLGKELCLVGLPHEPFAEYCHFVERVSPFKHNVVLGYTNGLESYIGTEKDYLLGEQGGYETSPRGAALMFACRLPPVPKAERLIHAALRRLLATAREPCSP